MNHTYGMIWELGQKYIPDKINIYGKQFLFQVNFFPECLERIARKDG
jgi:hypothetical protein